LAAMAFIACGHAGLAASTLVGAARSLTATSDKMLAVAIPIDGKKKDSDIKMIEGLIVIGLLCSLHATDGSGLQSAASFAGIVANNDLWSTGLLDAISALATTTVCTVTTGNGTEHHHHRAYAALLLWMVAEGQAYSETTAVDADLDRFDSLVSVLRGKVSLEHLPSDVETAGRQHRDQALTALERVRQVLRAKPSSSSNG
jgi:hypothetical protein